jgi:hypothetical protein
MLDYVWLRIVIDDALSRSGDTEGEAK